MNGIDRAQSPFWKNREYSVDLAPMPDGPYSDLIGRRVTESYAEFQRQMNISLYGDEQTYITPSHWQRFGNWLADNRITNAWLVLIGREDIDREYR